MSELAAFQRRRPTAATPEVAARFFAAGDAWWRLNPEWEVIAFGDGVLRVRYERSEIEADWRVAANIARESAVIVLDGDRPRRIELTWPAADAGLDLGYFERFDAPLDDARRAELNLWMDATAGYLALAARRDLRARVAKWLLDKVWLRMTPTARRVGLLIVAMETLALLLFIAVVIVDRVAG